MSSMENIAEGLLLSENAREKFSAAVDKQNMIAQTGKSELFLINTLLFQY